MEKSDSLCNRDELEFAIFCIENIASYCGKDARQVYDALKESGILHEYIIPGYGILHTQGKEYIIADIAEVMAERGVQL